MNAALPDWFERLLQGFHSKSVGNRIGSAKEAEWLLQQCLAHVQRPTMVPLPKEVNPKRSRTLVHRMAICVVSAIAVGALLVEITRKDILVSTAQPVSPSSRLTASTTSETTLRVWAEWDREVQQIEQSLSELETTPGEDEQ
jgi:serine/threonine-protein kinase